MKIWIASDCTHGRYLDIPDDGLSAVDIAYKYGRAEWGEVVHIFRDGNTDKQPDDQVYWDYQRRKYRCY